MAKTDKSFEELRREHKELSDYSGRVAIIFLTILSLVVISFGRAWNNVQSESLKTALCKIQETHRKYETCRIYSRDPLGACDQVNVSYVFGFQEQEYYDNPAPCRELPEPSQSPSPYPSPSPTPMTDPSTLFPPVEPPCSALEASERKRRKDALCRERQDLERKLNNEAATLFGVKAPIPGLNTEIDLRYWILTLPLVICLCGLYLFILRKKLSLLEGLAVRRLAQDNADDVTELDRLYFEGDRSYSSFPSKLTSRLFILIYLALPVYLIFVVSSVAWTYREYGGIEAIVALITAVLTCVFYTVAYGYAVSTQLDRQMSAIVPVETSNVIRRFVERAKGLLESLAQRVSPRLTLAAGGVLVLTSMFLNVIGSVWMRRIRGFDFVFRSDKRVQFPGYYYFPYGGFSRTIYLLSLILAALIIVQVLVPSIYSLLNRTRFRTLALGAAGSIFLINVIAFSIAMIDLDLSASWMTTICAVALLLTFALLIRFLYSAWKGESQQPAARKIRSALLVAYTPLFLIAVQNIEPLERPGLLALLVGTGLLTLGLAHVSYRASIPDKPSKS